MESGDLIFAFKDCPDYLENGEARIEVEKPVRSQLIVF